MEDDPNQLWSLGFLQFDTYAEDVQFDSKSQILEQNMQLKSKDKITVFIRHQMSHKDWCNVILGSLRRMEEWFPTIWANRPFLLNFFC